MKKVKFFNIKRSARRIDFDILDIDDSIEELNNIFFEFDFDNSPSDIALSLAFCSMIKGYEEIYIDLQLPKELIEYLSSGLNSKVGCKSYVTNTLALNRSSNIMLLFSGGVDSVAAKLLLPNTTKLISFDYGEQFAREYNIIRKFSTNIIHTNYRNSKFFRKIERLHPPAFGIGSLLFCEHFSSYNVATGDILEASHDFNCYISHSVIPSSYIGMRQVRPTLGLTELGTTKVVYNAYKDKPQFITSIVESVAGIGSIKRYRKELLMSFYGASIDLHPVKNLRWGKDYVFDFLSMYMFKYSSRIRDILGDFIPNDVIEFINNHDLNFYEKINPKALISINSMNCINYYLKALFNNDIFLYTPSDFKELYETRAILASYYGEENKHLLIN